MDELVVGFEKGALLAGVQRTEAERVVARAGRHIAELTQTFWGDERVVAIPEP